jgi:hypothetical protein
VAPRENEGEMNGGPEEAEGGHDGLGRGAEGAAGGDGEDDHDEEGDAVDLLAAELVAQPSEEELAEEGADEGDAVERGVHAGGQDAGLLGGGVVVVEPAQQFGDDGDAEEIIGVGEEAHTRDHNGGEMVPLRLRHIQRRQHLQVPSGRHLGLSSRQHRSATVSRVNHNCSMHLHIATPVSPIASANFSKKNNILKRW